MPFSEDKTLVNNDSKVRIDVESTARVILSEIEYILKTLDHVVDMRLQSFLLESAISKTASVFQLAMRACDYLERKDLLQSLIAKTKKGSGSNLGSIGVLREEHFHNGHSVLNSERFYPFAQIKGRGYVGIYVHSGACLQIPGCQKFTSPNHEYAITSDGIFEIHNVGTDDESWHLMDNIVNVTAVDMDGLCEIIKAAIKDLKAIWKMLRDVRVQGDAKYEFRYLNEGGAIKILNKGNDGIASYELGGQLRVKGFLTITPPDGIKLEASKLSYFIQEVSAEQGGAPDASGAGDL